VAIAGASSLRGKELKQLLDDSSFPAAEIRLLDEDIAVGTLTAAGGEPALIQAVDEDSFKGIRFVFFTGTPAFTARHWEAAQRAGATLIDLSGGLTDLPSAFRWIPALDPILPPPQAIVILQPVSERGSAGVEELESQTIKLLSFQPIAQEVFDAQVAFNLLDRYGETSGERLSDARSTIARDVRNYLAGRASVPAIQLIQAPVFYSYAFTAYAELGSLTASVNGCAELQRALKAAGIKLVASAEPAPSNVSVAGESCVVLGHIERDPSVERGYWFWGAADNLRLAAANAVSIAEKLFAS